MMWALLVLNILVLMIVADLWMERRKGNEEVLLRIKSAEDSLWKEVSATRGVANRIYDRITVLIYEIDTLRKKSISTQKKKRKKTSGSLSAAQRLYKS